jgi:hypothetical protein
MSALMDRRLLFRFEEQDYSVGTLEVSASSTSFTAEPSSPFLIKVAYSRPCEAFRGLGHVLGTSRYPLLPDHTKRRGGSWLLDETLMMSKLSTRQKAHFTTMGTMIDCSRNGVLLVDSVRFLCRKLALMGYNMLCAGRRTSCASTSTH